MSSNQHFSRDTFQSSSFSSSNQSSSVFLSSNQNLKKKSNLDDFKNGCNPDTKLISRLSLKNDKDEFDGLQSRIGQSFNRSDNLSSVFDNSFFKNSQLPFANRNAYTNDFPDISLSQSRETHFGNASLTKTVRSKVIRKIIKRTIVNGKVIEEEEEIDETESEPTTEHYQMQFGSNSIKTQMNIGGKHLISKKEYQNLMDRNKANELIDVNNKPKAIEGSRYRKVLNHLNIGKKKSREAVVAGKIQHIINELLTTEEKYVKDLQIVYEDYMRELERVDAPQEISGENRGLLFGNLEIIYMFHDVEFLTELRESPKIPEDIAKCFLKHRKQFSLYRYYNKNKPGSEKYLAKYGCFFKQKQAELKDIFDLGSYLIKPTQRLCRYTLLMEDLAKDCKKHKIAEKDVGQVVDMLKAETRLGNDLMALDAIVNCDMDLKDQGELIYRDGFNVSKGSEPQFNAMVFLFEKIMLFTKKIFENNLDVLHYQDFIYLQDIGLTEMPNNPTKFEVWFHKHTLKPYILETYDKIAKERWVSEIRKQLQQQLQKTAKEKSGKHRTMINLKNDDGTNKDLKNMTFISSKKQT